MVGIFRRLKANRLIKNANKYVEQRYYTPSNMGSSFSNYPFDFNNYKEKKVMIDLSFFNYKRKSENLTVEVDDRSEKIESYYNIQYSIPETSDRYNVNTITTLLRNASSADNFTEMLKALERNVNQSFVDKLLYYIERKGVRDSEVYKAAYVDKRLFSKMISNRDYKPSKDTAISFAFALKLTLDEAYDLLSRAGYTLSHSNKRDIIIEYFFRDKVYDLLMINEVLHNLDLKIIGRS